MDTHRALFAILLVFVSLKLSFSLRILQVAPGISNSHLLFNYKFARMLRQAGHNVTLLTIDMSIGELPPPNPAHKMEEIRIGTNVNAGQSNVNSFQGGVFQPQSFTGVFKAITTFNRAIAGGCQRVHEADEELLENLTNTHKFDILLTHYVSLCPLGIAYRFNITKWVWVAPGAFILVKTAQLLSLPNTASYIPDTSADVSDRMTFFDRTTNFLYQTMTHLATNIPGLTSLHEAENAIFQKFPNENFPPLPSLAENTGALLINGEDFLDFPRPHFTNIVHMGDLGRQHQKQLAEEWQSFMDNSKDGVIIFSLGTIANTSLMPIEMKEAYLKAFSQFPTYSIIWRLEGEMPKGVDDLKNLKIVTWIPQKDLLHHPKLKLFITHGGYNSLLETVQAGIPMILIPLFGDQFGNARRAERHSLGLILDKLDPNAEHITGTIRKVLTDEKFQRNAKRFSSMLQDKIISSENFTLHLINKIAHSTNWPLPKAAKELNYLQYFCLDIIFVFVTLLVILCYTCFKVSRCVWNVIKRCRL